MLFFADTNNGNGRILYPRPRVLIILLLRTRIQCRRSDLLFQIINQTKIIKPHRLARLFYCLYIVYPVTCIHIDTYKMSVYK